MCLDMQDDRGAERDALKKGRRRGCVFCGDVPDKVDYRNPQLLRYFITDRGKIVPRRVSGTCAKHQREIALAIKRARNIALLPYTSIE